MPEAPKEDNAPEAPAAPVEKAAEGDGEPEPVKTVSGLPHRRFTSFSISDPGEIKPIVSLEKREAEMLTQERLEELWKELLALCAVHSVTWIKVRGHADNPMNNRRDELARGAIKAGREK